MAKLNKTLLKENKLSKELTSPVQGWDQLPEKVLQFGTGVLLRGLPDYFIDKANQQGVFNGRVVVVKSTVKGGISEFEDQDSLYTLYIKGIENGNEVQKSKIISSISRVLAANEDWEEIIDVAMKDELELVISNTTEVGIVLDTKDDLKAKPPHSFPAKLTALLYKRFLHFRGDESKGLVILPTELISDNGSKLKEIIIELSRIHNLGEDFINWIKQANHICNTLVDRIVPGKLSKEDQKQEELQLGYMDDLAILVEPFRLWAIESNSDEVKRVLSFASIDKGVVIVPDIGKLKELKLRLLNGSHTFSCGLALLCGFSTVKEAMRNEDFVLYLQHLLQEEIIPAITGEEISVAEANDFAGHVVDRFSNPFLDHSWKSICFNYTSKLQMRTVALIENYSRKRQVAPQYMALGFAAYLLFMKDVEDESSLNSLWKEYDLNELVDRILKNQKLWNTDLSKVSGFAEAVKTQLQLLLNYPALEVIRQMNNNQNK
ncbi:tagaturonate reductase [Albibacterium bauzanense]|uniref:Tagaturonate reductase n=1 Tax=Albibacterium bauzanense TaxID=653929 RepID=A0A4R1M1T6_9SPHI|nr:tagaturonate reductase [Albibacterium bauzanense]TCK85307.1 tagaturonate reductase [Albibacterium bauzanense]